MLYIPISEKVEKAHFLYFVSVKLEIKIKFAPDVCWASCYVNLVWWIWECIIMRDSMRFAVPILCYFCITKTERFKIQYLNLISGLRPVSYSQKLPRRYRLHLWTWTTYSGSDPQLAENSRFDQTFSQSTNESHLIT